MRNEIDDSRHVVLCSLQPLMKISNEIIRAGLNCDDLT
jgi:hypothetical protein